MSRSRSQISLVSSVLTASVNWASPQTRDTRSCHVLIDTKAQRSLPLHRDTRLRLRSGVTLTSSPATLMSSCFNVIRLDESRITSCSSSNTTCFVLIRDCYCHFNSFVVALPSEPRPPASARSSEFVWCEGSDRCVCVRRPERSVTPWPLTAGATRPSAKSKRPQPGPRSHPAREPLFTREHTVTND